MMDAATFHAFVSAAAARALCGHGKIGRLVLTQTTKNLEPRIREPEMRHALAQEAQSRPEDVFYGIEVPTRKKYRFTTAPGEQEVSARHDFVILSEARFDADRLNLLELKRDQPPLPGVGDDIDCPAIRKDIIKLILEKAGHGKSMLHICHAADCGTIPGVLRRYNAALRQALRISRQIFAPRGLPDPFQDPAWFTLFVLVARVRGAERRNGACLYRAHLDSYGEALRRVHGGEVLFDLQEIESVPLCLEEAEGQ
jgi:hypothetical protein